MFLYTSKASENTTVFPKFDFYCLGFGFTSFNCPNLIEYQKWLPMRNQLVDILYNQDVVY